MTKFKSVLLVCLLLVGFNVSAQHDEVKKQIREQTKKLIDLIDYKYYKSIDKKVKIAVIGFEGMDGAASHIEAALTEYDRTHKNKIIILPRDDYTLGIIKQRYKDQKADFFDHNDKIRLEGLGVTHIITGNYYEDEKIFYLELVNKNAQLEGMTSSWVEKNSTDIENYKIDFDRMMKHYKVEQYKDKKTNIGLVVNKQVYNYLLPESLFENQYKGTLFNAIKRNKYNNLSIVSLTSKQIDLIKDEVRKQSSPYFEKDGGINLKKEDLLLIIDVHPDHVFYKLISMDNIEQLYSGECKVTVSDNIVVDKQIKPNKIRKKKKDYKRKHIGFIGGRMYVPDFSVYIDRRYLFTTYETVDMAPINHLGIALIKGRHLYTGVEYAWSDVNTNKSYTTPCQFRGTKLSFGTYNWSLNPVLSGFYLRANDSSTDNVANIAGFLLGLDIGKKWIKIGGEGGVIFYSADKVNGKIPYANNLFDETPAFNFSVNMKIFF